MTQPQTKPKLLVLLGPTASGKTKLSIEIAKRFGCEIISGDSMQVYKRMNIGTAKITPEEMQGIPHYMINIHEPDYPFSAAEFQESASSAIRDISSRGKLPFVVGGTGLYIESLCYSYEFSESGSDEAFREEQYSFAARNGAEALHDILKKADPPTAERLHPNDLRRVVRALEILHTTGIPVSEQLEGQKKVSPYELCIVGLTMERDLLYKRIEERIDLMMEQGLVDEVRHLLAEGCPRSAISLKAIGYKEILGFLDGEYTLERAVYLLKRNTRRFAKRQLSWFRHMNDIQWVDVTDLDNFHKHMERISGIITETLKIDDTQLT
ncbi:tRNA (adenosine(37)-N6)-dimethylallyltransferase MiaA [Paenibacillus gansuensis]|uniref:tRNA dimethylallyltransferase n=1 Tax=Paenibacillus gansuensis TaxID=306542 RepID=A0ABW5PAJ6_9BACL